ncbi:MAG: response regulator [Kofleriaceae bacterium]
MQELVRVLVVDDDRMVADMMREVVGELGYSCAVANTGAAALAYARTEAFDIGLLDIALPDLSGYVLARHLRDVQPHAVYLAAFTGWPAAHDANAALAAGFDQHVLKPIKIDAIRLLLERAADKLRSRRVIAARAAQPRVADES